MNISPEQIAGVVAGALVLVVWIFGLRDQQWWNRDQKRRREKPPEPERRDDGNPPTGPWG